MSERDHSELERRDAKGKRPCRVATLANPTTMDTSEPVTSPAREEPPAEESVLPSPPAIDAADDEVDYGGSPDADHRLFRRLPDPDPRLFRRPPDPGPRLIPTPA